MHAMILAAGRGERMRPLTDHTPKPLLQVGSEPLIGWHIRHLASAGIRQIAINHAHLGQQIEQQLGTGDDYGVRIRYSPEATALETAGGIATALPLLANTPDSPFLVVNGDILTDIDFLSLLASAQQQIQQGMLAHLVLVPNPPHNEQGDFSLIAGAVGVHAHERSTFSGIGLYHPALFADTPAGQPAKLGPLLKAAAAAGKVSGQLHTGFWLDVGTPARLEEARTWVASHWDATR
nr:nucleotidyltransferase family protein [Leeia oryzae]